MVQALAVCASVLRWAPAEERAHLVYTGASVTTGGGRESALVHVLPARLAMEVRSAVADVVRVERQTFTTIGTGVRRTRVGLLARFTYAHKRKSRG